LRSAGYSLADEGTIAPLTLDGLSGRELTTALRVYIERARRGDTDAPLVAGTAKDLTRQPRDMCFSNAAGSTARAWDSKAPCRPHHVSRRAPCRCWLGDVGSRESARNPCSAAPMNHAMGM
jgi:hypothetical protein